MEKRKEYTGKRVKIHNILWALGAVGVIVLNTASWKSVEFSDWYIRYIFPIWLNTYARLTSMIPISIGEIMLVMAVVITLFGITLFGVNLVCKRKYIRALRGFGTFYVWTALIVSYIMTLNCFILYHGSSFSEKYMLRDNDFDMMVAGISDNAVLQVNSVQGGQTSRNAYTKSDLAALRDYLVKKCNTLAMEIERDDSGSAYYDGNLIEASRQAMIKLGEDYDQLSGFYVRPKYLACSEFFSQQNIMGYYFPFSMEANINSVMHITNVAPTVCHELAHTKGFIYEDDANMIGFLACINSDDTFLQYCGYLSVLNYVNNEFYESIDKDTTKYRKHVRISDTVADDNIFLTKESWQEVEKKAVIRTSTVKKVSGSLMDTTLKINGVEEGVLQYNGVVGLLLDYYDGELY